MKIESEQQFPNSTVTLAARSTYQYQNSSLNTQHSSAYDQKMINSNQYPHIIKKQEDLTTILIRDNMT